jgi:anti-sigma factor RsiW
MKCPIETRENSELLLAYCARKLDPETTISLERHLAQCPSCREYQARQQAVWEAMDAWEAMPVSADFNRRLYRRIEEEAQTSWWSKLMRPLRPMFGPGLLSRGLPLAATLCLLVMAGALLQRSDNLVVPGDRDMSEVRLESVQPDEVERALDDMDMLRTIRVTAADSGNVNSM